MNNNAQSNPNSQPAAGVRLQPMLHVEDMEQALRFFVAIGGAKVFGSGDGDWALLRFGNTELSLLGHPPNREQGDAEFELNFISSIPFEQLETRARTAGLPLVKPVTDEAFGRQMILKLPSGMLVKINEN